MWQHCAPGLIIFGQRGPAPLNLSLWIGDLSHLFDLQIVLFRGAEQISRDQITEYVFGVIEEMVDAVQSWDMPVGAAIELKTRDKSSFDRFCDRS